MPHNNRGLIFEVKTGLLAGVTRFHYYIFSNTRSLFQYNVTILIVSRFKNLFQKVKQQYLHNQNQNLVSESNFRNALGIHCRRSIF